MSSGGFQLPPAETPPGVTPPKSLVASRKEYKQAVSQIDEELREMEARKKLEAEKKQLEEEEKEEKRVQEEERKKKEEEERKELDKKPKAKVLIAADSDAIFDWQLRKMLVTIPMHQACRPYLERTLCEKMRWPDIVGYAFYKALGSSVDNVESTNEPLQTNLTPQQLRMQPNGINFVMVKKSKRTDDEILVSANEYFRYKVEKFLELYDPHRLSQAGQLLRDNQGNEQNLIDALLTRYGPEPTDQQIADKRAFLKQQKELADAAAERARQAGLTNSIRTLSEREKENVMRILEKVAWTRVRTAYYRKWRHFVIRRRLNNMIVHLSVTHLEKVRRAEYWGKLKRFAEDRKNKRQLAASSQIAIKNEQLLGDLASQNMSLKNEIRKLTAHIEVLENASSKRLQTLYSGSETAVKELKRMTSELRNKAVYVNHLQMKEEQSKEKLAKAEELRDEALALCEGRIAELESSENDYRYQLRILDSSNAAVEDKIKSLERDVAQTGVDCKHCPHYWDLVMETEKNAATLERLRNRVEDTEGSKRAILEQIEKQREDLADPQAAAAAKAKAVTFEQGDNRVPQIFLDIEEAARIEREKEIEDELSRQGFAGQEELAKRRKEKQEEEERKKTRDKLNKEALESNNNNNKTNEKNTINKGDDGSGGGGGELEDGKNRGVSTIQSEGAGTITSSVAASQSLLGPVGRADLSMARYFDNEINRSRSKFASSVSKQWTTRAMTPFALRMEEQRKVEAAEAMRQNSYHITRRQANQANAALLADSGSVFQTPQTSQVVNNANNNNSNNRSASNALSSSAGMSRTASAQMK